MEINQTLRLVADFLKDQGLLRTYAALVEEASLPNSASQAEMTKLVDAENWPGLLKVMARTAFKNPQNVYKTVY